MFTQARIVGILAVVLAIGAFGGVYQFYFKDKLASYASDETLRNDLHSTYNGLVEKFGGGQPKELTRLWVSRVPDWVAARDARAKFFKLGDWFEHERPPEDVGLLRYWYEEEVTRMLEQLYKEFQQSSTLGNRYPGWYDIRSMLNAPSANNTGNVSITENEVNRRLSELSFGMSACRLLMDNNVSGITDLKIWPTRTITAHSNLINLKTVGVNILITAKDLVHLLDATMRMEDRYFTVDAIRIQYPYIAYESEPQLQVQLLFTQASFKGVQAGAQGAGAPNAPGLGFDAGDGSGEAVLERFLSQSRLRSRDRGGDDEEVVEPGVFGKAWKWIKRNIFYISGTTLYPAMNRGHGQ